MVTGSKGKQTMQQFHEEVHHKGSNLILPTFDGSGKVTIQSWVQKLDIYESLNPMTEDEAIKFAISHLDGIAHYWFQSKLTRQHFSVMSYMLISHKCL